MAIESPEPVFGLRWGIKGSFIDYVRRMPDGKGWLGNGAVPLGAHEVLFPPQETGAPSPAAGVTGETLAFRGEARFSGHFGMLFVRLASPVLTLADGTAELTVETDTFDEETETGKTERLGLVTLRLEPQPAPPGFALWNGTDVRLTEAGTGIFNDVYPPGEAFEPLTVLLPAPVS